MDSNVSKNTFSHKFFKLPFNNEDTFISIEKLLKYQLCSILDLYLQSLNSAIDPQFFVSALKPKIEVLEPSIEPIYRDIRLDRFLLTSQSAKIIYKCSIALALAPQLKIAPQTIAMNLVRFLTFGQNINTNESSYSLNVEITESGWIDFYLDSKSIATYLKQLFAHLKTTNIFERSLLETSRYKNAISKLNKTPENLFSVQYIHARCCSLLRLAAREKLIVFRQDNFSDSDWQLSQPESISWLDTQNNLWLKGVFELNAIASLFTVADLFTESSVKWDKVAVSFSQEVAIVLSECRFLGEVKQKYPQKAIARLGLIILSRYYLSRILVEKLNLSAPISL